MNIFVLFKATFACIYASLEKVMLVPYFFFFGKIMYDCNGHDYSLKLTLIAFSILFLLFYKLKYKIVSIGPIVSELILAVTGVQTVGCNRKTRMGRHITFGIVLLLLD